MKRTDLVKEIISDLEKINGNKNIKQIREKLEEVSGLLEMYDESNKLPTAICGDDEDEEIKKQVEDACKVIKDLKEAINTRTSPIRDPENPGKRQNIPTTAQGNNLINSYVFNLRQLNKYLALVFLLKEDFIKLDTFDELVGNLRENKIGGFNKRRRETRKNKSKRKKPKNKSTRKTKQ